MKNLKSFFAGLTMLAFFIQMFAATATAQFSPVGKRPIEISKSADQMPPAAMESKIAPDLQEKSDELFYRGGGDVMQNVIIQLKSDTALNEMSGGISSEADRQYMFAQEVKDNQAQ